MLHTRVLISNKLNRELYILLIKKALISLFFAILTGASSKLRFFLPFTPVPITGQVFMVLLSGILLGPSFGSLSQMIYVFLGISGIPWFALGSLFGPTGGYLVGFIIAPYIVGTISSKKVSITPVALILAVAVIYTFGAVQFSLVVGTNLTKTMKLAVYPFIPFDLLKAGLIILFIPVYKRYLKNSS